MTDSSSEIEFLIVSNEFEFENILFLFKTILIFEDIIKVLTNITSYLYRAISGEITLSVLGTIKLSSVENLFIKKIKKEINKIKYNLEDIELVISRRIYNCPLNISLALYKQLPIKSKYYLFISQIRPLDNEDIEEFSLLFKEFDLLDIKMFPINSEEIFLLCSNLINKIVIIGNQNYRMLLLDKEQFIRFINKYESEISLNK